MCAEMNNGFRNNLIHHFRVIKPNYNILDIRVYVSKVDGDMTT